MCAAPATIAASPEPSMSGAPVRISGTIAGAGGAAVQLWEELPRKTVLRSVASTTAGAGGAYSFTRPAQAVTTNRNWYVTSGSLRSAALSHEVEAKLTLSASLTRPMIGRAVTVTGAVGPSHAGERVLLEQQIGQSWTVIARTRLSHASRFRVRHRFRRAGTVRLQALLPADRLNVQSHSAMITLTVKRAA
jgi:hypothetical protein